MELLHVAVQDSRTMTMCDLIVLDRKVELKKLNKQSESLPRVLSVDGVLKGSLAVLQLIVLGLMTWVLTTVVDHGDRLTKTETIIDGQERQNNVILSSLSSISVNQIEALKGQATVAAEISNLKEELKRMRSSNYKK